MKKSLLSLGVAIFMLFAAPLAWGAEAAVSPANPSGNPIDQLTGKIWQNSIESNKESILFGVDLAVAANYFANKKANEKAAKKNGKQYPLPYFDRCWIEAFKNISRKEAVKMVDDWYAAHPDELDRPVLGVIWHEIIVPHLDKTVVKGK